MRRRNWYTGQLVTEGQMDTAFSDVENAVWRASSDMGFYGVLSGHVVAEDSPASLDVIVSGGTSYTPDGKRCFNVGDTTVDCSQDRDSVSTAVVGVNSSKWLSIFAVFDRNLITPEYDITNNVVYTVEEESMSFEVVQGNEVANPASPTKPALRSDAVLLADILLISGQTSITTGDIDLTRREALVVLTRGDGSKLRYSRMQAAMQAVLDLYEDHIAGSADQHDANDVSITVDPLVTWADGATWSSVDPVGITDAIETHVVTNLATIANGASGASRIGIDQSSYQSGASVPVLAAGPLRARLESMRDASNIYMPALASWPSGDNSTNPAAPVNTSVSKLVANIGARASSTDQGSRRIGLYGTGFSLASWQALGASTVWSLFDGLNAATGTHDGANYIGAKASGALLAGTVRSQLDALDTRVTTNANAIAAKVPQLGADSASDTPTFTTGISATFQQATITGFSTVTFPGTTDCLVDDIILITYTLSADVVGSTASVALFVKEASMPVGGVQIEGTVKTVPVGNGQPVTVTAMWKVTEAGQVLIIGKAKAGGGGTITYASGVRLDTVRLR